MQIHKIALCAIIASVFFMVCVVRAQQHPSSPQNSRGAPRPVDAAALADPERDYIPGEVLVKFRSAPSAAALAAVGAVQLKRFARSGVEHWRLGSGVDVERALGILRGPAFAGTIEYAEPNYIVHAHDFPNDPLRGDLWGMHNIGQSGGIRDADIDALEAWQVTTGSPAIVVGVIDTGIDYTHPDLAANIWVNPGESPGNGVDDDNNGYIDDVMGWDFYNNDNDPMDDNSHGTHTAGTIGAVGNNNIGVAGVAWNVKLMPLKFLGAGGSGPTSGAIEAVEYAASFRDPITNGPLVRVTNNSWGGGQKSRALEDAIKASNSLFVASAGNSASSRVQYPAGYKLSNVFSVAATDNQDQLARFSSYGSNWVDLGAPGVDILSTTPNNTYGTKSGTSMAAPDVAGTAALVLGMFPAFTPEQVKDQILSTTDALPSLQGITASGGRLNAARAVDANELPPDTTAPGAVTDLVAAPALTTANTITLNWTASGDDDLSGTAYAYDVRYSTDPIITDDDWDSATPAMGEPLPTAAGSQETFILDRLQPDTTYYVALKVTDEAGNVSALSNVARETTLAPPPGGWQVYVVESERPGSSSLTYAPDGKPAIAYSDYPNDQVKFAKWNGSSWEKEVAGTSYTGVSLAYDAQDNPTISHGWGKLYFTMKNGSSWSSEVLERRHANNDVTSLAYCNGNPAISYRTRGGLKVARRSGSVWTTEDVDSGAGARYTSLAFDGNCNPAVAYSDDIDSDGWLDTLKFARWNGSSWNIEIVDTGPVGYGVGPALAFDPVTGYPSAVHRGTGQLRFFRWNGSAWESPEAVDNTTQYVWGVALTYDQDGTAYLGFGADYGNGTNMTVARRDPGAAPVWSLETVEVEPSSQGLSSIKLAPDGEPSVTYELGNTVRFAKKGGL